MKKEGFSLQGAAEIVLSNCDQYIGSYGQPVTLTEEKKTEILSVITQMAGQGLRTLCLSYRDFPSSADTESEAFDFPPEEHLTVCCIVGIKVRLKPYLQPRLRMARCTGRFGVEQREG